MDKDFEKSLYKLAKSINIELLDEIIQKFYDYMNLLLEWNEKINLTAITEMEDVVLKHFIDSLTVLENIGDNKKIIDVGTGAGFPGIPISIMKKNCEITLLDSLNKRILFLDEVSNKLDLTNIQTIHGRAEEIAQNKKYREMFDISISRAVANLTTLVEYLIPMVKVGGNIICMKGSNVDEELKNAEYAIKELGGKIEKVNKFTLPGTDMERNIIIIKKIKTTDKKYPRKAGTPSKMPLIK